MNKKLGFRASLMRCSRLFSDEINTILLPYQLNYSLWQVMFVLQYKKGCTSIEIAEYLNVSKPSVAKRTAVLSQLNVVTQVETEDKRQKKLVLSSAGEKLYQQCSAEIAQLEQQLTKHLNSQDLLKSTALLHLISDALENIHQVSRDE